MKSLKITFGFIALVSFLGLNEAAGQWAPNGSHIYNTNAGNVGVGYNTPASLLHVGKNMTEPTIRVQNFGGAGGATFQMIDNASTADWKFKATNTGGFKIRDNFFALDVITVEANSMANSLYIDDVGNIGLGTNNPVSRLHIEASASLQPFINLNHPDGGNAGFRIQESGVNDCWIWREGSTGLIRVSNSSSAYANHLTVSSDGRVGINTSAPATGYALSVNGKIVSTEVLVEQVANWPDYVFSNDYELMPLMELESTIKANNHLPGIPSAAEVESNGILLGEMQKKLLEKVEELTLYTIEQEKKINDLQSKYNELLESINNR